MWLHSGPGSAGRIGGDVMLKGLGYSDWRYTLLPCYHFRMRSWAGNLGRVYRSQARRGWKGWDMLTGAAPVMKAAPQGACCALGFWHALVLMLVASETVARFR